MYRNSKQSAMHTSAFFAGVSFAASACAMMMGAISMVSIILFIGMLLSVVAVLTLSVRLLLGNLFCRKNTMPVSA